MDYSAKHTTADARSMQDVLENKYRCLLVEAKIIRYAEYYSKLLKQLREGP